MRITVLSGYKDKKRGTLSRIWNSIRNSEIVSKLTFEQEEEMIDTIAGVVNKFGMESPSPFPGFGKAGEPSSCDDPSSEVTLSAWSLSAGLLVSPV